MSFGHYESCLTTVPRMNHGVIPRWWSCVGHEISKKIMEPSCCSVKKQKASKGHWQAQRGEGERVCMWLCVSIGLPQLSLCRRGRRAAASGDLWQPPGPKHWASCLCPRPPDHYRLRRGRARGRESREVEERGDQEKKNRRWEEEEEEDDRWEDNPLWSMHNREKSHVLSQMTKNDGITVDKHNKKERQQ